MKKRDGFSGVIGIVIGVAIAALLGFATYQLIDGISKKTDFNQYDFYSVIEPNADNGYIGDHVKGSADAPVLIFEYADYQCSHCASMNPKINAAIEALNGKVAVVYRSFLLSYFPNGTAAASAAEAAGLQGYWKPYMDKLFETQDEWGYAEGDKRTAIFVKYFNEVSNNKGDIEKFKSDLGSENVSKKISFDMGIGKRIDIEGTPALYVEGQKIVWSEASSITVNGKEISWDSSRGTEEGIIQLFTDIANAKLGK